MDQLAQLYCELDAGLALPGAVNRCGTCNACCRSEGRVAHGVSELELLFLESRAGSQAAFRVYLTGRHERTCPHYLEGSGCQVYPWRPFSCRVFGHYREAGSELPPTCTYGEVAVSFPAASRLTVLPGAARLKHLQLELTVADKPTETHSSRPRPRSDALDVALKLARQGDVAGTCAELEGALASGGPTGYTLYNAGLIYSMVSQPEKALESFLQASRYLPERADVRYYAATQAMFLGHKTRARQLAEEARKLAPDHAANLSLLGSLYRLEGRFEEARDCLLPLDSPLDRFFLGEVWVGLGELEKARACFEEVSRHEPLHEQARAALLELENDRTSRRPSPTL